MLAIIFAVRRDRQQNGKWWQSVSSALVLVFNSLDSEKMRAIRKLRPMCVLFILRENVVPQWKLYEISYSYFWHNTSLIHFSKSNDSRVSLTTIFSIVFFNTTQSPFLFIQKLWLVWPAIFMALCPFVCLVTCFKICMFIVKTFGRIFTSTNHLN